MKKFTAWCIFFISLTVNASHAVSSSCDIRAGMSDSNVLALSSQAGFCQTYGFEVGKPECVHLSQHSYQSRHLTLHGLWPNQNACGQNYGFCDVPQRGNHCDYSPLNLSPEIAEQLKKIMPSYQYGSCLERHEWNKHGSCQTLSTNDYFALAMRLTSEVDQSAFGVYLTQNYGNKVSLAVLREKISEAFGKDNNKKIYLGCKNGILVDIYIQLPAQIPADQPIGALITEAPHYVYRDSCPSEVKISSFHQEAFAAIM